VQVRRNVRLADLTTLAVGGPIDRLVEVHDADELVDAVRDADESGRPLLVLGGGSNVVAPDQGWPGDVVLVRSHGIERSGDALTVQAGHDWDALVAHTVENQLAGIEALSGIPGSTGATPIQNVGAYGQEVAQTVTAVRVYDRAEKSERTLTPEQCGFAYRDSRLKREPSRFVVLEVDFALHPGSRSRPVGYAELARTLGVEIGETAPLADVRDAVLELRRGKGMV
jgi:UDP-N-acetylmuramate dehydrogenase